MPYRSSCFIQPPIQIAGRFKKEEATPYRSSCFMSSICARTSRSVMSLAVLGWLSLLGPPGAADEEPGRADRHTVRPPQPRPSMIERLLIEGASIARPLSRAAPIDVAPPFEDADDADLDDTPRDEVPLRDEQEVLP